MPLIPVLTDMELAGVQLDQAALAEFLREVQAELARLTRAVHEAAGDDLRDLGAFNIRSSQQLAVLLFDRLHLPRAGKTRGGRARTDQEVLEKLQGRHPIIDALLDYRKLEKMRSTYLEPLPRLADADGRIRTTFNQTSTATGRLSSSNPNLQNIPIRGALGRRMRACFTAAPGFCLISADYSQIELRVLAHLSQEPALLAAFHEGADIHTRTAGLLFNKAEASITPDERRDAKTINFGLIYGMGPQSLAKSLGIGLSEARDFIARYFSRLSRLKDFYDSVEQSARAQGFVTTLAGRRRLLPDMHSDNSQIRSQARRQAINTLVQGSAADIIKLAMLAVHGDPLLRSLQARLILQVHDELLIEAPEGEARKAAERVADLMAAVRPGGVTLDVALLAEAGIGHNWGAAH
jgi:DNA polymerase-1